MTKEYLFLTCYVDVTVNEYVLGTGPSTLTVAYDHIAGARSFDLYRKAHLAGEFGEVALRSESEHLSELEEAVWESETALRRIVSGRESVLFLAPMGAYHAIAIEAWRVVDQWDLQTVDGTVNAVRYGTYPGDPEHTQTLANLKSRITTAAASDAFATSRIANVSGLEAYYRQIGAYGDITPDDGETTTFTPAQPPPSLPCGNGDGGTEPRRQPRPGLRLQDPADVEGHAGGHGDVELERHHRVHELGRRDHGRYAEPGDGAGADEQELDGHHPGRSLTI